MAEGPKEKKVYFTRFRKRSMENGEKSIDDSNKEQEIASSQVNEDVIDLTQEVESDNGDPKSLECAICLQNCIHPARLPCGHVFCFLCVKGAAHGNRKCAMCRSPIPHNYFSNPELLETPEEIVNINQEGYEWFYEGRQGWWQYDQRASAELERAWAVGETECELLIAGFLYTIDLKEMVQARKGQPSKRRRIKRDLAASDKLGVAGLRDPRAPPPVEMKRRYHSPELDADYSGAEDELDLNSTDYSRPDEEFEQGSVEFFYDFLEEQFADLSLASDDDDSYQ